MIELGLTRPRPMAVAMIGAVLLLSLSACGGQVRVDRNVDISGGSIEVEVMNAGPNFEGRVDVHRINEDGSTGEVIGSAPVNSDTLSDDDSLLVELDLSRATDVLAVRLYDEAGQNPHGMTVQVVGAGSTLASDETTDPLTSAPIPASPVPASPIPASPTPVPETAEPEPVLAYTGPIEYIDPLEDCHFFNRDPADCPLGIDMERILIGLARTEAELADWINSALAKGYGVGEIQFTEPMAIFSIIINGFDPAAGNLCVIFASPQENFTPSISGANVVQTCTFADSLTFTTRINANGERNTEFGEAGPIGNSDLKTTITLFQPLGSLFRDDPPRPFSILMNNNEGTVLDSLPVDNLLNFIETDSGP